VTARERETLALFGHFMKDRRAFHSFLDETQKLVTRATAAVPEGDLRLTLHTLKGNAAVFGLEGLSALADDLEEELLVGGNLSPDAREELSRAWGLVCSRAQSWLQEASGRIEVRQRDIDALERAISAGASPEKLKRLISEWGLQDAAVRLERLRSRAMRVAQRLGKENLRVELRGEEVRLETNEFEEFWATFTHVVNNAVDHGQEPREQRLARGKDPIWTLRLEVRETPTEVCVCAWDDGSGIDWERLRSKATARGIAIPKEDPPTELLFEAGLSSRDAASEISGRGVGMAAVKEAVAALGGYVQVESEGGRYTQIACHLPRPKLGAFTHRTHHA
jgi:chemotaxis protein histidine kinase CheA